MTLYNSGELYTTKTDFPTPPTVTNVTADPEDLAQRVADHYLADPFPLLRGGSWLSLATS